MKNSLKYKTLEKIPVSRPVNRLEFITDQCRGLRVLDIGCLDETAMNKQDAGEWLHSRIAAVAENVIGIDLSDKLNNGELDTGPNSIIRHGDGTKPDVPADQIDIIVAGEFIEHLENPLEFLRNIKALYSGKTLVLSTPNGTSAANSLLSLINAEAQHPDHLLTSTYKTLNTLAMRSGAKSWDIVPYKFYATEMLLESGAVKSLFVRAIQIYVRLCEKIFPLKSFGYIVKISL